MDKFHPLTGEDAEQFVQDVWDTPDVQDFIKKVLGWYHAKKNQIN